MCRNLYLFLLSPFCFPLNDSNVGLFSFQLMSSSSFDDDDSEDELLLLLEAEGIGVGS